MYKKIDEALQWVDSYEIDNLLHQFHIRLINAPEMNKNKMDSLLKIFDHESVIFIKTDLNEEYRKFILYHEIGHYLLHYQEGMKFTFYLSRYKSRLEMEANLFACSCLLNDVNYEDMNIIDYLTRQGVPYKIAIQFYESKQ